MLGRVRAGLYAASAAFTLAHTIPATAQKKVAVRACIQAHEHAQELRQGKDLLAAQAEFEKCTARHCPAAVRADCARDFEEIRRQLPSMVLKARSGDEDLSAVRVWIDGVRVSERLDGAPVPANPGERVLRFEWRDRSIEKRVVLSAGEKLREVVVVFESPKPPGARRRNPDKEPDKVARSDGGPSVWPWLLAGGSVAAFGSFGYFALSGRSGERDLASCEPECPPARRSEYDGMRRDYLIADVSLGIGVVLAVATVWAALDAAPGSGNAKSAQRRNLEPAATWHGF